MHNTCIEHVDPKRQLLLMAQHSQIHGLKIVHQHPAFCT